MLAALNRWIVLASGLVCAVALGLFLRKIPGLPTPEIGENRVLATLPSRPGSLQDLKAYREGVDAYVADNFPARTHLIAGINYLRYRLNYSGTSRVVVGRQGWLFYDDGSHLGQLRHPNPLSQAEVDAWTTTFAARVEMLGRQGIDYVVMTPPVKERVFPERAPDWARNAPYGTLSDADALKAAIDRAGIGHFLALKDALVQQKTAQGDIYSAFDTHWTGHGAYVGYVRLLQMLRSNGHDITPLPLSAFTLIDKPVQSRPQDLAVMLGIASFVHQDFVQYHDPDQDAALKVEYLTDKHDWTGARVIDTGNAGKPVLQMVVDSFSNDLLPFLYPHFSRIVVSHNQDGFFRTDLTERFRPDIVVLEVIESGVRHSMSPSLQPSAELSARLGKALSVADSATSTAMPSALVPAAPMSGIDATTATPPGLTYQCNLETLTATGSGSDARITAAGWMADVAGRRANNEVTLVLQSAAGSFEVALPVGLPRADVAAYFRQPALERSGFESIVSAGNVPQGRYDVYLRQMYDADRLVCKTKHVVKVTDTRSVVIDPSGE